jgi:hypothetical protein
MTLHDTASVLEWTPAEPATFEPERFFLSRRWFELKHTQGHYRPFVLSSGGEVAARVAVREVRTAGLVRRWEVLAEPALVDVRVTQAEALSALIRRARADRVDLLESFSNMARWTEPGLPEVLEGAQIEAFGTYVVDLAPDDAQLRASMHSEHRRLLRKAEAAGVEVRDGVPTSAFIDLMDETYGRGGKDRPFDSDYLMRLLEAPGLDCVTVSAWLDGQLEAAAVVPFDRERGYFLHGASRTQPAQGATIAVQAAVLARLKAHGVARYDLGGARRETDDERLKGIFRFKQRVGGVFEDCVRWRLPLSTLGRHGLSVAQRLGRV